MKEMSCVSQEPKPMLKIIQNVLAFKMFHKTMTCSQSLQHKEIGAVILRIVFVSLFVHRT